MNSKKTLQKQILSLSLSLLFLFVSCNQYDDGIEQISKNSIVVKSMQENMKLDKISLSDFTSKHIQFSKEVTAILKKDKNLNLKYLSEVIQTSRIKSYKELDDILKLNKVKETSRIIELIKEMEANGYKFLERNPNLLNLNKKELEDLIANEIYSQVYSKLPYGGPCEDEYNSDMNGCHSTFAVATGVSVVGGFLSGGIMWALGGTVALLNWISCTDEAFHDMEDCLKN